MINEYFILFYYTHTRLTALFPGLPGWAGTRKVKPIWILLKQETVSGSRISWAICKSALCSRQITTPATHHSVFYRPDALPAAQPTVSKHWRDFITHTYTYNHMNTQKSIKPLVITKYERFDRKYTRFKVQRSKTHFSLRRKNKHCWVSISVNA